MQDAQNLSRRTFLGGAVVLVCSSPLAGCGPQDPQELKIGPWVIPPKTTFAPERFAQLAALFDALIPADKPLPGATATRAAFYLDQLLGAFRVNPPRIFAGGPYSGRHGGADNFSSFQRLTRVEEIRWRTYLEGSLGIPEREFNGPVKGLTEIYEENLEALEAAAQAKRQRGFAFLPFDERHALVGAHDPEFVNLAYQHAVEGTYGDPVYGGNKDYLGWKGISYEGDRQPLGYSAQQMANPEEG